MTEGRVPENISHESLLAALKSGAHAGSCERSLYETQLRHRLSVLSRKLKLVVAVQEATGMNGVELIGLTTEQLLILLDECGCQPGGSSRDLFRHFW